MRGNPGSGSIFPRLPHRINFGKRYLACCVPLRCICCDWGAGVAGVEVFDLGTQGVISVFHKLSPYWRGGASALTVGAVECDAFVVETDPDAGSEKWCVAHEPRVCIVLSSASFSGGGIAEIIQNASAGSMQNNIFERGSQFVTNFRFENIFEIRLLLI